MLNFTNSTKQVPINICSIEQCFITGQSKNQRKQKQKQMNPTNQTEIKYIILIVAGLDCDRLTFYYLDTAQ